MIDALEGNLLALIPISAICYAVYEIARYIWSGRTTPEYVPSPVASSPYKDSSYSSRKHRVRKSQSDTRKAQRLLQKARDTELRDYVLRGNQQWALNHLRQEEIQDLTDEMEMNGLTDDPFVGF